MRKGEYVIRASHCVKLAPNLLFLLVFCWLRREKILSEAKSCHIETRPARAVVFAVMTLLTSVCKHISFCDTRRGVNAEVGAYNATYKSS